MATGRTLLLGFFLQSFGANSFLPAEAMQEAGAVTCAPGRCGTIALDSTDRAIGAHGMARIARDATTTTIDVEFRGMKPATLFGGDYNTYILWVAGRDDRIENLGEVLLNGARGSVHASTEMETFAILVTAEPHFMVERPSPFVVLLTKPQREGAIILYRVQRGVYNFERAALDKTKEARGPVFTAVKQAWTAVQLAERAGARELAQSELSDAQQALDVTFSRLRGGGNRTEIKALACNTVRLAVGAQTLALGRAVQNAKVDRQDFIRED
jgi:hypothetical protein